ncbi:hypothetical protein E2N92_12150 [Methanofollis formosanus]|uniref:DUF4118 domain-containing protein n=1 Tax=Methanofollis formosanus TaxID=299308 RepID=A0A8G1A482_9EURY|nr:DUF4118 domain-containing protein [Methanofollis formosanus]QYZ80124.1 hypothetical protein E2N92_12150 [Methanofollis formosanus]
MDFSEIDRKYPWGKPVIVAALIALSVALEVVVHIHFNTAVAYTHIFYLVIALTGIWYYRKAAVIALVFGLIHIGVDYWMTGVLDPAAVVRAAMFVIVAYVIGALSESSDRYYQEREEKHRALVGFVEEVRLRIKGPIRTMQEDLAGICRRVERGEMENDAVAAALEEQIAHAEKVVASLRELQQGVIEEHRS